MFLGHDGIFSNFKITVDFIANFDITQQIRNNLWLLIAYCSYDC